MFKRFMSMMRDEEGQGLVEYSLIVALISVVCIVALTLLGTNVQGVFNAINAVFPVAP